MELKIINKNKEPLLARTKVEAEVIFEKATPSREEIKNKLATDLGKDKKLIVVKAIYTIRGLKKATNLSYVYENEEALKRIEVEKKKSEDKKEDKEEVKAEKPEAKKEEKTDDKKESKQEQKEVKKEEQKPKEQLKEKKQ